MARHIEGPWFRKSRNAWYATLNGRMANLKVKGEGNGAAAQTAWHRLMAGLPDEAPTLEPKPQAVRPSPKPTALTVCDLTSGFLVDATHRLKPATVRWLVRMLAGFTVFDVLPAEQLTPDAVEQHVRGLGGKPNTQRHRLASLVQAVRWAVRTRRLSANPLAGVRLPTAQSRGAEAVITPADHARLIEHAEPSFKPFIQALWLTGTRPGELAGLMASQVGDAIRLQHHKSAHKGLNRVVYLSPEALALFREQAQHHPSGPLFRNTRGQAWTANAIGHAMRAACRRAGLPVRHAYGYRHAYATEALARGVPDATVAALLGHSNTAMLFRHYSHLSSRADVLRAAAARVR